MKIEFLRETPAHKKLILIVAGWNTTPAFYSHIRMREGWDLAVAWDFEELSPLILPNQYSTIYVYAWSFGVVAAEAVLPTERITEAFAIAGTPQGIGQMGIPEVIFNGTRDALSLSSLIKFRRRMLGSVGGTLKQELLEKLPADPDIEQLRRQLDAIYNVPKTFHIHWRRAYIPESDMIIPPGAQRSAWENHPSHPEIVSLPQGHYVDLQEIIATTVPDTDSTAAGFYESLDTYSEKATAQTFYAERLIEEIQETGITPKKILEIGNGSGTLSRMMAALWPTAEATFVDLCETKPYNLFAQETYIQGDAETWLEEARGAWDLVVSGSAIQWFANPRVFFRNARRLLRPGGVMGCSIFSAGNLRELDAARPSPIHYHSASVLGGMAGEFFGELKWMEIERKEKFGSAREALLHLRDTGVRTGLRVPLSRLLAALRPAELTYSATLLVGQL